jgi:hypothetical protein
VNCEDGRRKESGGNFVCSIGETADDEDDDEGKAPWLQLLSAEARHEPESVIHSGWSLPLKRGFEHEHDHDNEHDFKRSRTFEEAA